MRSYIHFLTFPNFDVIESINVKFMDQNRLIQINDNEILIVGNTDYLKIIDINNWQNTLTIRNHFTIRSLLKLNDSTIIYSGFEGIKRIFIKTMTTLPDLIEFNSDLDNYYEYEYYSDEIVCFSQLKNGTIIACSQNGIIRTFKLYV